MYERQAITRTGQCAGDRTLTCRERAHLPSHSKACVTELAKHTGAHSKASLVENTDEKSCAYWKCQVMKKPRPLSWTEGPGIERGRDGTGFKGSLEARYSFPVNQSFDHSRVGDSQFAVSAVSNTALRITPLKKKSQKSQKCSHDLFCKEMHI